MKTKLLIFSITLSSFLIPGIINTTSAGTLFGGNVTCIDTGNCSVEDMVSVAIIITQYMLGIIGSIALLFFIISGIKMLLSQGNQSKISEAKQMMAQTIIGIIVFLSAYLIVDFVQKTLLEKPIMIDQTFEKNNQKK